ARFGQGQQKIVVWSGRALYLRHRTDLLASFLIWFTKRPALCGFMSSATRGFRKRGPQFVEMFGAGQQCELAVLPGVTDGGGMAHWRNQRGHQDVGIDHHAHQALSALPRARRLMRTSRTASSTMRCNSPGSVLALRILMS